MSTFGAVVVCFLSALGLAALIWAVAGALLLPLRGGDCRIYVVLESDKDSGGLSRLVRALIWFRESGWADYQILISNEGMKPEAAREAELLAQRGEAAILKNVRIEDYID